MKEVCILAFLAWNSWRDIRSHEISLALTLVFGVGGLVLFWQSHEAFWEIAARASIGLGMTGMSVVTKGGVGTGDGLLLLALSGFLTVGELLLILFLGLFLCALWGAALLVSGKRGRNTEIPFIPFLSLGYLGGMLLW